MLNDYLSGKSQLFSDGVHTELRAQENRLRRVSMVQGNLVANGREETSGTSARVYKNGVYGFSSSAETSAAAAETVLKAATNNALFLDRHIAKNAGPLPRVSNKSIPECKVIRDTNPQEYVDFVREIDSYIMKKYPDLSSRSVSIREDSMEKIICTSDGSCGHITSPRSYVLICLNAETAAGIPVELFEPTGGFGNFDDNFSDPSLLFPRVDAIYELLIKKCLRHSQLPCPSILRGGVFLCLYLL